MLAVGARLLCRQRLAQQKQKYGHVKSLSDATDQTEIKEMEGNNTQIFKFGGIGVTRSIRVVTQKITGNAVKSQKHIAVGMLEEGRKPPGPKSAVTVHVASSSLSPALPAIKEETESGRNSRQSGPDMLQINIPRVHTPNTSPPQNPQTILNPAISTAPRTRNLQPAELQRFVLTDGASPSPSSDHEQTQLPLLRPAPLPKITVSSENPEQIRRKPVVGVNVNYRLSSPFQDFPHNFSPALSSSNRGSMSFEDRTPNISPKASFQTEIPVSPIEPETEAESFSQTRVPVSPSEPDFSASFQTKFPISPSEPDFEPSFQLFNLPDLTFPPNVSPPASPPRKPRHEKKKPDGPLSPLSPLFHWKKSSMSKIQKPKLIYISKTPGFSIAKEPDFGAPAAASSSTAARPSNRNREVRSDGENEDESMMGVEETQEKKTRRILSRWSKELDIGRC